MRKEQKSQLQVFMVSLVHNNDGMTSRELIVQTVLLNPHVNNHHASGILSGLCKMGRLNYKNGFVY